MNNSNEIDRSEFSLMLKFKELSQQYFQLSAKSSLSDDELDLIDSILERAQDNKILSDLISDCDRELHGRTLLPDKGIVNSLRNQALQILESIGDNNISDTTSRLANLALLRANGVSDPKLKFIYNLGFYSGIDILFDSISGNPDFDLEKTIESFSDGELSRNDVNCPFFPEDPTSNNIEVSNFSRGQFIDQIIDLYSPRDECANLVREYFYISSGSVVSETQADRVEEILDQSQTDPILRSFIGEIDRWILEGANLMNPGRCKEYESQKLELKAFVQNQQIPLDAAIACQLPSSLVLSSEDKNRLTKSEQTCFNVNPFWKNPLQQVGNSLWANMTNVLSNPRLLGTVCLTTMAGAFVSLLFLNSKCFNAFLDKDSPSEQRSAISFLSSGDVSSTDQQNHSNSANVLSLQRDGSWQNSHPSTMLTASNPSQVYELVSALESGQSLSENRQLSSEWNQKSAEARQLMAESYQKFAETQQLLASTRQIKAEDQQQQTRAEFWLTKAQEWRDLSTKWANQAVIEKSQAEAYLKDSQHYLSRARQYSLATDAARSGEVKVVSTSREEPPSLNSKLDRLEGDSLWTLSHDVLFAGHLAVVAMSAIGLGVSIGVRKSQQTAR
jgi:hypothetical protein